MITVSQIKNGEGYLTRHLTANDYYCETPVEGYWLGKGAERLGLTGKFETSDFEALRVNRNPGTGEKLTPRAPKVAFHDITVSAPKSFSIAAIVGGDERLVDAFRESCKLVHSELEKYAAVRLRSGHFVSTEATERTGNVITAAFQHDSSRLLDPQLHTHLVTANASFSMERGGWFALQPREMLEASRERIQQIFYDDLADRATLLGYTVVGDGKSFRIQGISPELEERYSQRSAQRRVFEERYKELFGSAPSKVRVEQFIKEGKTAATARFRNEFEAAFKRDPSNTEVITFVKDWRSSKMVTISTAEVRQKQLDRLSIEERHSLQQLVSRARASSELQVPTVESETEMVKIVGKEVRLKSHKASISTDEAPRERAPQQNQIKQKGKVKRPRNHMTQARMITMAFQGKPSALIRSNLRRATRGA